MNASEIAKIEDVNERAKRFMFFIHSLVNAHKDAPTLLIFAWDVINQQVTKNTIALANRYWRAFDIHKRFYDDIELPDIVKLIANHNPDFQPGEEAFVLLDDMVKIE